MMLADIAIAVLLAVLLSDVMFPGDQSMFWLELLPQPVYALALLVSTWVLTLWVHGPYRPRARWSIASEVRLILRALIVFGLVSFSFLYLAKIPDVSRGYMIVLMGVLLAGAIGVRVLVRFFFERARVRGKNVRSVLVLGTGPQGGSFATKLSEQPELGLRIMGFLGEPTDRTAAAMAVSRNDRRVAGLHPRPRRRRSRGLPRDGRLGPQSNWSRRCASRKARSCGCR